MSALLRLEGVRAAYGHADVLVDVSLTVEEGRIVCLLGANGAGKTTLIRCVLGLTLLRGGRIFYADHEITHLPTHRRVALGIGCIPEGRRVFPKLTVEENLLAGAYQERSWTRIREQLERVYTVFPRLAERRGQLAGTLSGGEQAMLSIGRGLMRRPRLLLVDEPSLGLSPLLVRENFRVLEEIHGSGVTIFLVEQNVRQTLRIAHYGYVLAGGRLVASGTPEVLRADPALQAAYFGSATA